MKSEILNFIDLACSSHCTECDVDECKTCDDGYQLGNEKKCVLPPSLTQIKSGISGIFELLFND